MVPVHILPPMPRKLPADSKNLPLVPSVPAPGESKAISQETRQLQEMNCNSLWLKIFSH